VALRALVTIALIVAYPSLALFGALRHDPRASAAAVAVLLSVLLLPGIARRHWLPIGAWLLCLGAIFLLYCNGLIALALYAVPVAIDTFIAWLFGHTLLAGREPLIARIIRIVDGVEPLTDPQVQRYARRLTLAWALLMGVLAAIATLLALFAVPDGVLVTFGLYSPLALPLAWWGWFAHIINYLIVALFFLFEFAWRSHVLPQSRRRSLAQFVVRIAALWPALARELAGK
jgi:uncharacterized membrane protein